MDSALLEVKLTGHKLFKDLKQNLGEDLPGKLRNLLELKDDVLYVWNCVENCLLSLNLKHLEEHGDETPYQKLHFLTPPAFAVERVMTSSCGSRVCVWGSRGVTIAELPTRWGRSGLFESGTETVLCKSYSLDERFLYCQGEIRRVHWHPSSLSHVLVLISDNTIRLYNIALKSGPKLVKTFSTGPKPTGQLAGYPLLDSLGDTAVDFTPVPDDNLLILRGNGDVYMMSCSLDQGMSQARVLGPLSMYPPADDNYGSESCSIVALGGEDTPPLVVVATCSAALYHCLLLANASGDGSHALYVVEAVELNVPSGEGEHSYSVHLYPCTKNTYACMHRGGLHTVTLPMLSHLLDFALADDSEIESVLSALCSSSSIARHLVRCGAAPRGVALSSPPLPAAMLLCEDGTLVTRILEPYNVEEQLYKEMQLKNPALEQEDVNAILKERQKLSFTSIIQEILTREVSQPILNIGKKEEPSPKESLELVTEATVKLRTEYMSRQRRATTAIQDKLTALAARAQQHNVWIADLQREVEEVRRQSNNLREKCALAEKYQEDLKYRCSSVIRGIRWSCGASGAERALLAELQQHAACATKQRHLLDLLKQHAQQKHRELKQWQEEYKKKNIALGKSHSDTIAAILQQQTSQISTLIEETKLLKDQLSIV